LQSLTQAFSKKFRSNTEFNLWRKAAKKGCNGAMQGLSQGDGRYRKKQDLPDVNRVILNSVHPEMRIFVQDQGMLKKITAGIHTVF